MVVRVCESETHIFYLSLTHIPYEQLPFDLLLFEIFDEITTPFRWPNGGKVIKNSSVQCLFAINLKLIPGVRGIQV